MIKEREIANAQSVFANVNNNCGIETIINRVIKIDNIRKCPECNKQAAYDIDNKNWFCSNPKCNVNWLNDK